MSDSGDDAPRRREIAYRLFATEFDDADYSFAESDEERAPNYVVTPTGGRVNRVFVVGVLTAVEQAGEDILRARVVDPTGAFVVYAGQYQPDAQTFFERADPPMFVAVSGKARTFQPDDSDVVYTSIRPESVNEVDAGTRDRWTVQAAEQTLHRVGLMATALQSEQRGDALREHLIEAGVDEPLAAGIPLAIDHYGTTGEYLGAVRDLALDAARVVAGEREEVEGLSISPGQGGDGELAALADADLDLTVDEGGLTSDEPVEPSAPEATAEAGGSAVGTASGSTATEPVDTTGAVDDESDSTTGVDATADDESPDVTTGTDPVETGGTEIDDTGSPDTGDTGLDDLKAADEALEESTTTVEADVGDFDPGEFELDDEEREEIESEFGTEFQSGTDVDEPGEADIETPDPEELAEDEPAASDSPADADDAVSETSQTTTDASADESTLETDEPVADATGEDDETTIADEEDDETTVTDEEDSGVADASDEDVDLADAAMDAMAELDDGSGADRQAVIDAVTEQTGADADAIEDAIQDALMGGRCYEPDDETLKPI